MIGHLISTSSFQDYVPVGIQFVFATIFIIVTIVASHFLGPKRGGANKLINFECGIEQQGDARQPMAIKYFLIAILFVIFDVELVFFYPYAVNFKLLGKPAFWGVVGFSTMFLVGYTYVLKKGILNFND